MRQVGRNEHPRLVQLVSRQVSQFRQKLELKGFPIWRPRVSCIDVFFFSFNFLVSPRFAAGTPPRPPAPACAFMWRALHLNKNRIAPTIESIAVVALSWPTARAPRNECVRRRGAFAPLQVHRRRLFRKLSLAPLSSYVPLLGNDWCLPTRITSDSATAVAAGSRCRRCRREIFSHFARELWSPDTFGDL